jgi:hypothetical protein
LRFGYTTAAIAAALVLPLAACASGDPADGESEFLRALPPDLGGADLTLLGSVEQLIPLADGYLSFGEYEQAFFAMIACLESEGLSFVSEPSIDSDGTTNTLIDAGPTDESLRQTQEVFSACRYEHFSIVQAAWAWKTRLTEEEVNVARRHLAECLRERDIDISDIPSDDELDRLMETQPDVVIECSWKVEEETGIQGF